MIDYCELHCHSYYSLLDGASSPQALVERAAAVGMQTLALTDHDNLYGAISFAQAAHAAGIRPIFGAELMLEDQTHLTLLVRNAAGWQNLCHLITLGQQHAPKGQASLPLEILPEYTDGLLCLTGCQQGSVASAVRKADTSTALRLLAQYREWFGHDGVWVELQHHLEPGDSDQVASLVELARQAALPVVATNNVHYATRTQSRLQDVLVAIRHNRSLDDALPLLRRNSEFYLKSAQEMLARFAHLPEALANSSAVASLCHYEPRYGLQDLPPFPIPEGLSACDHLRQLCLSSPRLRHPERLDHELRIIQQAGLCNYFLIVHDIVREARRRGIRCQGRGSAANSLVAYVLGISPIDPIAHDLVFERFLSAERQLAPDIDIDFDAARREEIIQYLYTRYGTDHAAMACTFSTYRLRGAIRDVSKALGIPHELAEQLGHSVDRKGASVVERISEALPDTPLWRQFVQLVEQIRGIPRHLSIHNGGMVLAAAALASRMPVEPAAMPGRVVTQWDKEALEDAGIVKIDILGLRMLSAVEQAAASAGVDIDALSFDDPAVFAMISAADTIGVFQVESRAQAQMLPRFQPRNFEDLIIAISLIRPGPLQGDMVHPYLRRRLGDEAVTYLHASLRPALQETLGVILFQEQVLKVARDLAGFSPGQGELLRRALGKKDAAAAIEAFRTAFLEGAQQRGVPLEIARSVFVKLLGFGSYSFPKSHAASFAVVVYQSAWLRHYHPAHFYAALLNNQPMGFWSPSVIVHDARRHRIRVLPVDLHASDAQTTTVDDGTIRLGLSTVRGMGETALARLLTARQQAPFRSLADLCKRAPLPMRTLEYLIQAGALNSFDASRRKLLWELGKLHLEFALPLESHEEVELPTLSQVDLMRMEHLALGLSTGEHLMTLLREWATKRGILHSASLHQTRDGAIIFCAGLVVVQQAPPTAKGFRFLTLEDEFGFINVIVKPAIYEQYQRVIRDNPLLLVEGEVQRQQEVIHVLARRLQAATFQTRYQ